MPSLEHYATWSEALDLVRLVVGEHRLRLIPEVARLLEPRLDAYDTVTSDVEAKLAEYPVLQLEGTFTKYPLEFGRRNAGTASGTYYATFNVGPRLRWSLSRPNSETGDLIPGAITMIDQYLVPGTSRYDAPSPELRRTYLDVVKTLKANMVKVTVREGATAWVGKRTQLLMDAGSARLQ